MNAQPPEELRISLRHLTLAARAWGDPADPPMLAVHGWLDNAATFDRLAPLLEGRYLVAIDLAGHGRSQHRPAATWYPYVDYLDDLGAVIDWFGWASVDLLGHSLGAALVSTYAAMFPERTARLLLIEGLGPLTQSAENSLEQLRRAHAARGAFRSDGLRVFASLEEAVDARCRSGRLSAQAARFIVERGVKPVEEANRHVCRESDSASLAELGAGEDSSGEETRTANFADEASSGNTGLRWATDPQLTVPSPLRLTEQQLAAVLPAIDAPSLLVLAEPHTSYLLPAMMEARIALLRKVEVLHLAGTHHLHLEDPAPVAAAIRDFLDRHPVSG